MALLKLAILLAAMSAGTTGLALPGSVAPPVEARVQVEDVISVTMWQEINWSGPSGSFSITTQTQCYGLSGGAWDNSISSIQVPGGYRCRLWDSNHCDGDSTPDIYAPGADSLPSGMDNKATSFKCYVN